MSARAVTTVTAEWFRPTINSRSGRQLRRLSDVRRVRWG